MSEENRQQSFRLPRGEAVEIQVTMLPEVGGGITGMAIRFRLRAKNGTILLTKATGDGITITGPQAFKINLTSAETLALSEGDALYDVFRIDAGFEDEWIPRSFVSIETTVNFG
jgi:hypothetical protein